MHIEARLEKMGLTLPAPTQVPAGMQMPFAWVRVRGNRAYLSGHIALNDDGSFAQPMGKVGAEVTIEQGYAQARAIALAHLATLQRALGDLDRVTAWLRVFVMVNAAPDFTQMPLVGNGYSDLIVALYGQEIGVHARSAVGMQLPFNASVEIEAEVEID